MVMKIEHDSWQISLVVISIIMIVCSSCSSLKSNFRTSDDFINEQTVINSSKDNKKTKTSILKISEDIAHEIYIDLKRVPSRETNNHVFQKADDIDLSGYPLTIMTFTDTNHFQSSVDFGRTITECLIASFEQKGFNVLEFRKTNEIHIEKRNGEYFLSRDIGEINKSIKFSRVLVGTYSIGYDTVIVNARLLDIPTGKIVASSSSEIEIDENIWFLLTNGGTLTEVVKKLPFDFDKAYLKNIGITAYERRLNKY